MKMVSAYGEPLRLFQAVALLEALGKPAGRWHMHPYQWFAALNYVTITIIIDKKQPLEETVKRWMENKVDLLCDREVVQDAELRKDTICFKSLEGEILGWITNLAVPIIPIVDEASKW